MTKIIWVNFLHMYQPPVQERGVWGQVAIESYDYLFTLLEKYPRFTFSLSISGSLLEQMEIFRPDLLARLQRLASRRRIELVATAKHHHLLPLLPRAEAARQIAENALTLKKYFPKVPIRGFFLPEMAFDSKTARLVAQAGYQWLILDPLHSKVHKSGSGVYGLKGLHLKILFRNREISRAYPPRFIYKCLKHDPSPFTLVSASDAETYGHFHKDRQGFIEKILVNQHLKVYTVSQYLSTIKKISSVALRPASWESQPRELAAENFYSLWQDPKNNIHRALWDLAYYAINLLKKYRRDKNCFWARRHLDYGLSSCTFWWASRRRPSPFAPLTWNPDMVDRGAEELVRSVRSLTQARAAEKIRAEKMYLQIKKVLWWSHWRYQQFK